MREVGGVVLDVGHGEGVQPRSEPTNSIALRRWSSESSRCPPVTRPLNALFTRCSAAYTFSVVRRCTPRSTASRFASWWSRRRSASIRARGHRNGGLRLTFGDHRHAPSANRAEVSVEPGYSALVARDETGPFRATGAHRLLLRLSGARWEESGDPSGEGSPVPELILQFLDLYN
jgi:hypothetical protein